MESDSLLIDLATRNNNNDNIKNTNFPSTSTITTALNFNILVASSNLDGDSINGHSSNSNEGVRDDLLNVSRIEYTGFKNKGKGKEAEKLVNEPTSDNIDDYVASTSNQQLPTRPASDSGSPPYIESPLRVTGNKHWSTEEDTKLRSLVLKHGAKKWGMIARLLAEDDEGSVGSTNVKKKKRSAPSCTARWCRIGDGIENANGEAESALPSLRIQSNPNTIAYSIVASSSLPIVSPHSHQNSTSQSLKQPKKYMKWTSEEDKSLIDIIIEHGPVDWRLIASSLSAKGFVRSQDSCNTRWTSHLSKQTLSVEVKVQRLLINDDSNGIVEHEIINHVIDVDKLRYIKPSKSNNSSSNPRWTPSEDAQLKHLKLHFTNGSPGAMVENLSWATIGAKMKPNRSSHSCRARWGMIITNGSNKELSLEEKIGDNSIEDTIFGSTSRVEEMDSDDCMVSSAASSSAVNNSRSQSSNHINPYSLPILPILNQNFEFRF